MIPARLAAMSTGRRKWPAFAADDWAARSTAPGVILAEALNTSSKLVATATISATQWLLANGTQDHVTLDGDGWRFAVLNSDTTASGDVGAWFGNVATFGQGSTFWAAYEMFAPPEFCYAPWLYDTQSGGGSHKSSILSDRLASNRPNEIVVQQNFSCNQIGGYWQDGQSSSVIAEVSFNGSDFRRQPSVDRGLNPLSGTNPDTGAAWSAAQQERARYGQLYTGQSAPEFKRGHGDPFSGGFRQVPDEWITLIQRVQIGTWDTNTSRWTLWAARQGQAPQLLHDMQNIRLGNGPDYNCLWLTPYTSNRLAGGRKVSARTNAIQGLTVHGVCGLSTPIGDGTLEYNAATGRVRWQGLGEAFGTARGFSSANGILTRSVASGGAADSYLVVTANPAALPASGTHTETVSVGNGRPDTYVKYRRVIVSTQSINAPGGFAPIG